MHGRDADRVGASLSYRPDIDGLRAVAVLSVVLYHYGAGWLPGGFTGVDIFFVISGYLITALLRREMTDGHFSLLRFYDRRIRRILPALLLVLAITLAIGWFVLLPGDYADLGSSAASAAVGFGNLFFFWNTDYFDQAADLQPLLHTWSLGVEEQFYLVWPLLLGLVLSKTRSLRLVLMLLAIALLLSLGYAVYLVGTDPKAAFYLPAPRAWELGIGALIAFLPPIRSRLLAEFANLAGLALVVWSIVRLDANMPFPGYNALYACVGSALVIWPKPTGLLSRILALRPAVVVGLISYSLYLWHWPVLVLYRHYQNGTNPDVVATMVLLVASLALAWLSWRYVERPFRRPFRSQWRVVGVGLAAAMMVVVPAASIALTHGAMQRVPESLQPLASLDVMWEWDCTNKHIDFLDGDYCVFGAPLETATSLGLLWGDSHAEHMAPLVEQAAREQNISFILYRNCPAALGDRVQRIRNDLPEYADRCTATRQNAIAALHGGRFDTLILASSWNTLARVVSSDSVEGTGPQLIVAGLHDLLEAIRQDDVRVVIVDQMPAFGSDPHLCQVGAVSGLIRQGCADLAVLAYDYSVNNTPEHFPGFEMLAEEFPFVQIVYPRTALCLEGRCLTEINGEILHRDSSHIRRNLKAETLKQLADMIGLSAAIGSHPPGP